jgi:hypothetical protein
MQGKNKGGCLMKMTKTRKQDCPACGNKLNDSSHPSGDCSPGPGDITICAFCRKILAFGDAMDLRLATDDEITEVGRELNLVFKKLTENPYSIISTPSGKGILCHCCGNISYSIFDVENRYCGHCHRFLTAG